MPIIEVLEGAGVSIKEIDAVLNDMSFQISERLARYLNYYKSKKLSKKMKDNEKRQKML